MVGLSLTSMTELKVAGVIHNSNGRGKTVPGRVRNSLVWLQRISGIVLGAEKAEIQRMARTSSKPFAEKEPDPAPTIPAEYVRLLEKECFSARTGVLRIFCGLGVLADLRDQTLV